MGKALLPVCAIRVAVPDNRHWPRRSMGLRLPGMGRLLGMGPGRERKFAPLADVHRPDAQLHGVPTAWNVQGLGHHVCCLDVLLRDSGHVHQPLRPGAVGPYLRRRSGFPGVLPGAHGALCLLGGPWLGFAGKDLRPKGSVGCGKHAHQRRCLLLQLRVRAAGLVPALLYDDIHGTSIILAVRGGSR